ncbi:MAG: ribonuclease M5 [Erysipelotrichaceae bacterium]
MKLKEIIVVEGKHDSDTLKKYLDCDTIETNGTHLGKEILSLIAQAQKMRGVIIFTDPDAPGEKIRSLINQNIKGCKNAFVDKAKAKTSKKVGIEHASKEVILSSLEHLMTYSDEIKETLSYEDFIDFNFMGKENSTLLREKLGRRLFIGKPNAKTLFKRLNMLQLNKKDIETLLEELK